MLKLACPVRGLHGSSFGENAEQRYAANHDGAKESRARPATNLASRDSCTSQPPSFGAAFLRMKPSRPAR